MERDFCYFNLYIRDTFLIKGDFSPYKTNRKHSSCKHIVVGLDLLMESAIFELILGKEIQRHALGGKRKGNETFSHDKCNIFNVKKCQLPTGGQGYKHVKSTMWEMWGKNKLSNHGRGAGLSHNSDTSGLE